VLIAKFVLFAMMTPTLSCYQVGMALKIVVIRVLIDVFHAQPTKCVSIARSDTILMELHAQTVVLIVYNASVISVKNAHLVIILITEFVKLARRKYANVSLKNCMRKIIHN
jgi:hypothetical protein